MRVGSQSDDEAFLSELTAHDPLQAVAWGLPIDELPSLDPGWWQERQRLWASRALSSDPVLRAAAVVEERWMAEGEHLRAVHATIDSPLFAVRQCLDEVSLEAIPDVHRYSRLLRSVPRALDGFKLTLREGAARGKAAARRQVIATADALDEWSPAALLERVADCGVAIPTTLRMEVDLCGTAAAQAFADFASFLRGSVANDAREDDAVGREAYRVWASRYFADDPDLSWYEWAIDELVRILDQLAIVRKESEIAGASDVVRGAVAHQRWVENFVSAAGSATSGIVPLPDGDRGPVVKLMPRGGIGAYSAYYSPPTGDEPGAIWIAGDEGPHYVEYEKVLIAHEGVPGHHAETAHQRRGDRLTAFQKLAYLPAHSEGWGLYSEQLADETGLFDTPHSRAGYLGSLALRVASVVVDMGVHCSLLDHQQELWTIPKATALLASVGLGDAAANSWMTNILGRPGHRSTYAIGKLGWVEARENASRRGTPESEFHIRALAAGPCDLTTLRSRDFAAPMAT